MANIDMDDFFSEEGAVEAATAPRRQPAPAARKSQPAPVAGGQKPPSFGMVVAIAVVALLLGVGLGYFAGMFVTGNGGGGREVSTTSTPVASTATTMGSMGSDSEMPSSHPDLSQFYNEDGSINEEALDAYRAERAESSEYTAAPRG